MSNQLLVESMEQLEYVPSLWNVANGAKSIDSSPIAIRRDSLQHFRELANLVLKYFCLPVALSVDVLDPLVDLRRVVQHNQPE